MIPATKAEILKLLTVRSTYIISGLAFLILIFMSFYGEGLKGSASQLSGPAGNLFLASSITQHSTVLSVFGAIVSLLVMTHEYRYNTITYTLTAANGRSKVLAAKIAAVAMYTFVMVIAGAIAGFVCMLFGAWLAGQHIPHQDLSVAVYMGKMLYFCESWSLAALLLGVLLRNQIGALIVLFVGPNLGEGLLALILRDNAKYLPFSALQQVIAAPVSSLESLINTATISPVKGGAIFAIYLVVGWAVAWVLFLFRDAV